MKYHKNNQRGDTILEVLISVAVLALILSTTFALANRSTLANRQASERSEAQKIAQAEMERLKLYLSNSGASVPAQNSSFCINLSDGGRPEIEPITGLISNTEPIHNNNDCRDGIDDMYYRYIQRGSGSSADTYTVNIKWPAVTGNGIDQVIMVHKLYPELFTEEQS